MVTILAIVAFGGGFAAAVYAIVSTVAPNVGPIADALFGRQPGNFSPLSQLVRAERRIAVRRWAALPARPTPTPLRAAA